MIFRLVCFLSFVLAIQSCNSQSSKSAVVPVQTERVFEMVSVPAMISDPTERADYLAKNYWNKFDFSDTTLIGLPELTEQALANFIDLLAHVSPATQQQAIYNRSEERRVGKEC